MPAARKVSKEQIIDAAVEVLRDDGFSAINARSVAKKMGCSTQPIYFSFKNMDELKAALTQRTIELHTRRVRDSLRAHEGSDSRYSSYGMGFVKFAAEEKQLFRWLYLEGENDMLKILPPGGGNTKSPAAAAGVSSLSSAVAMVQADYLNRVNAAASPASLDELAGFVEAMGPDCCRRAFDIALDERITRWSYIRGILQDKQQRGVKCLADWDALDNRRRERGGNGQRGQERKSWTDICEEMEGAT